MFIWRSPHAYLGPPTRVFGYSILNLTPPPVYLHLPPPRLIIFQNLEDSPPPPPRLLATPPPRLFGTREHIVYVLHSYRLWSTLRPSDLLSGVITLACFTLLEWGVHINGIFVVEKGIPCSSFTKECFQARNHVRNLCCMVITLNKWLNVLDMSLTREETSWPFWKINTPHTQHKPLNPCGATYIYTMWSAQTKQISGETYDFTTLLTTSTFVILDMKRWLTPQIEAKA